MQHMYRMMAFLLLIFIVALNLMLKAQTTYTWNGGSGNWSIPSNWTPGGVPGMLDNVLITVDGMYTVTLDTDTSIASLTIGGTSGEQTLSLDARTLTVNGMISIDSLAVISLENNSVLDGSDTISNQGEFVLDESTLNADMDNLSGSILRVRNQSFINGSFSNAGFMQLQGNWFGSRNVILTMANGFVNGGSIQFYGDHSGTVYASTTLNISSGTLVNNGTINSTGTNITAGDHTLNAEVDNQGIITITNRELEINKTDAAHINNGTIKINRDVAQPKTLKITQSGSNPTFTNTGNIEIDSTGTLEMNGGTFNFDSGSLINGGTLRLLNNLVMNLIPNYTNSDTSTIEMNDSELNGSGSLTNQGEFILDESTLNVDMVNLSGSTLRLRNQSFINGSFSNAGFMQLLGLWSGSRNVVLNMMNGFVNDGSIQFYANHSGSVYANTTLNISSGTLVNNGTINSTGTNITAGDHTLNAEVDNQGIITITNRELEINKADAAHINNGTIKINRDVAQPKTLKITQLGSNPKFTNTGNIEIDSTGTLEITGGMFTNEAQGNITGEGMLHVANTAFTNKGSIIPGDSLGILTITGNLPEDTSAAINIEIGGFNAGINHDQLQVSGNVILNGNLYIDLAEGFVPTIGDSFNVITFGSRSGTFTHISDTSLGGNLVWDTVFTANSLYLKVTMAPTGINDAVMHAIPTKYELGQNYPNPFNPITHIRIALPEPSNVNIEVFNMIGQKVATLLDDQKPIGYHTVTFDASRFASGIYFYRIKANQFSQVRKLVLMK